MPVQVQLYFYISSSWYCWTSLQINSDETHLDQVPATWRGSSLPCKNCQHLKEKKMFFNSVFFLLAVQSSRFAVTHVGNLRLIDPRRYFVIRPDCDYIFLRSRRWRGRIYRPQLPVNRFEESREAVKYIWLKMLRPIVKNMARKTWFFYFAKSLRSFNDSDRPCVNVMRNAHERIYAYALQMYIYVFEIDSQYVNLITIDVTELFAFKIAEKLLLKF